MNRVSKPRLARAGAAGYDSTVTIKPALTFLALALAFPCFAQSPSVSSASPAAAAPGRATEITFAGANLAGATALWTSFGAKAELVPPAGTNAPDASKVTFRLTLPATQPVGIGAVRVATTNGVSGLVPFLVDDLPSIADNGTNKAVTNAQALTLPVAVDGACEELSYDFFKFTAKKGDRIAVDCVARRLGSALDPVVRVFDAKGRELAWSDDDPSAGRDSRALFEIPAAGAYFIEVRDIEYRGGAAFRYRLRVGSFPLVEFPFPFAAKAGDAGSFSLVGKGLETAKPLALLAPKSAFAGRVPVNAKLPRGAATGFGGVLVTGFNEVNEVEPNDTNTLAQKLALPCAVNGRFARPRDRDWFEFTVAKGERLLIASRTRTLGSPCDCYMELFKPDGTRLAATRPTAVEEAAITNTFTEAGTYRLRVEEVNRLGGTNLAYRIELAPAPAFALSVDTDKFEAAAGGSFSLKVDCARAGHDGPVKLAFAEPSPGFTIENDIIAAKATNTTMKVTLPAGLAPGRLVHLRLRGAAKVGEREESAAVGTMPALRKVFADTVHSTLMIPPELDGLIAVGVKPAFPAKPVEPKSPSAK